MKDFWEVQIRKCVDSMSHSTNGPWKGIIPLLNKMGRQLKTDYPCCLFSFSSKCSFYTLLNPCFPPQPFTYHLYHVSQSYLPPSLCSNMPCSCVSLPWYLLSFLLAILICSLEWLFLTLLCSAQKGNSFVKPFLTPKVVKCSSSVFQTHASFIGIIIWTDC